MFLLLLNFLHVFVSAGPCDIFASGGTPCAAAHSTTRSLYSDFTGALYQLKRRDNATLDIFSIGGFADAASHDKFCANSSPPSPPPSPSPPAPPPLNSIVHLEPQSLPGFSFRHCYSQGFVTPTGDSGNDHAFKLVAALSGAPGAYSFQSINFPGSYLAPLISADTCDLFGGSHNCLSGIVADPPAQAASFNLISTQQSGILITSLYPDFAGWMLAPAPSLWPNATCSHSYNSPAASVLLSRDASAASQVWNIIPDSSPYPLRADCVIQKIYDQSGNGNHLLPATPAINNPNFDNPVNATRHPISLGGHKVYGAYFESGQGYRAQNTTGGVARGNEPETIYMVTSGKHVNSMCCFDYGNSENDCNNPAAYCDGCMEAIYFGTGGGWCDAAPDGGPWVKGDLENGLYACGQQGGVNLNDTALPYDYVTAMLKGGENGFALKGGDSTQGILKVMYDGPRPPGYQPMHKTGAVILGVGGDNVDRRPPGVGVPGLSIGTFYEGVLTVGYSKDETDAAVQADIVSAGYGV